MKNYTAIFLMIITVLLTNTGNVKAGGSAPSNDNFQSATPIVAAGGSASVTTDNFNATKQAGEPNHAENVGGKSVWFSFTPTETRAYRINTVDTTLDTLLAVYKGDSINNLQRVGYNDDCNLQCGGGSTVDLMLVAGTTYHIAVDGYSDGAAAGEGSFKLVLLETTPPLHDNLGNAYNLGTAHAGSIAGTNYGASLEAGEPKHYNNSNPGAKTVWYRWDPTGDFSARIQLHANFVTLMAVYSLDSGINPSFGQLTPVSVSLDDNQDYNNSRNQVRFFAQNNKTYYIAVGTYNDIVSVPEGNFQLTFGGNPFRYTTDLESRDDKASISVFRPSDGVWYSLADLTGSQKYWKWGTSGDTPVPADYDGNGLTDLAVVRNENGAKIWYIESAVGFLYPVQWGLATDKAVVGDFDRDGRADLTVIRNSPNGFVWYVRQSSNGQMRTFNFGTTGDRPVLGDFDGDRFTDVAVTRNTQFGIVWYILKSGFNTGSTYTQTQVVQFGTTPDATAAEDFDGDGKTDIAVFRPSNGTWYVLRSGTGELQITQFGAAGDKPQPADYDGDGKADLGLFRPSTGQWFFWMSRTNAQKVINWGKTGDIPVSSMNTLSE